MWRCHLNGPPEDAGSRRNKEELHITPLQAGIMHAGYHGKILVGNKQKNCMSSFSLLYFTMVTCMQNACMQRCNSSFTRTRHAGKPTAGPLLSAFVKCKCDDEIDKTLQI